ncbi:ABC transporter permease [Thermodesulfobacterium sp. TA1]|uniref:ABC transporter permease n=1 Tax=Thermodesulfobacterium sp. TA1 TaxID=2234087 RepID=UPI001231D3DB|nr:ABC transporter permease [Thermodesulfobacterium sp. TA1]QER41234.1 ABC transporter permease [Thermodesulfobacterium sp. TA1]
MRFIHLLKKEFLQLFRDKILLIILIYAFTVVVYTGGKGINLEVRNFAVIVHDQSRSPESREFISKLRLPYFKIVGYVNSEREVIDWLDRGKASMAVIIPPDFVKKVKQKNAKIQAIVDGTMSMTSTMAISYLSTITYEYSLEIVDFSVYQKTLRMPQVEAKIRSLFNPNNLSTWFMSLLELFNMTTMVSLLISASALIREKEYGTIEQLLITPVRTWEVFLAKIIPTVAVIGILSLVSLFVMVKGVFKVPIRGSIPLFFLVTCLYVFAMSSLGIAIATVVNNLSQAMMVILAVLVPMLMISGAWTPPEAMHPIINTLSLFSPMRYYLEFGYGVLLKGVGLEYLWKNILGIATVGGAIFIFSALRFRKSFAK